MKSNYKTILALTWSMLLSHGLFAQWQGTSPVYYLNGNVGIGKSDPGHLLHIVTSTEDPPANISTPYAEMIFSKHSLSLKAKSGFSNVPYVAWHNSAGARLGYMGWRTDALGLTLENGYNFSINGGNVGIGTATPGLNLEIKAAGAPGMLIRDTDGGGDRPLLRFLGNTQLVFDSDDSGSKYFTFYSQFSQVRNNDAVLRIFGRTDNWGRFLELTHNGNQGVISTDIGSIILNPAGNVGIGISNPSHKLTVKGTIRTEEVLVELIQGTGPDYVFEKDYNLLPLSQVEAYINENKHLPEVPSAKEMEATGLNLKEMNLLLLKKVEELTLHLIEKEKKMAALEDRIEQLEKQ